LLTQQTLDLSDTHPIVARHQRNPRHETRPHLATRNILRPLGDSAFTAALALTGKQLMFGDRVSDDGEIKYLMSAGRLQLELQLRATAAGNGWEVATRFIDFRFR